MTPGTRLGPYEILAPIGKGGMGEVYSARDTKLDRNVAIKVLPVALAQHPDRLARFEREAKVLAALNHPNIAIIYGLEDRAIVMELVEGPTLADRISGGAIPLEESLKIAAQIADALEAAHEKGIVHRDLKPANVKVREDGTVKVLDFGLATAVQASAREPGDGANSPTLTMGATEAGMILGTASYMSPEQAAGKPVDRRADIWSFGVVLWEMLTGKRLFHGESVSHTLADVLRTEIDFAKLPESTPAPIHELLRRCLDRALKTRLQAIGEARIAIQKYLANPIGVMQVAPAAAPPSRLHWVAWATLAAALAFSAWGWWRAARPLEGSLMRLSVDLGPEAVAGVNTTAVISPDGTRLVFLARGPDGKQQLATRLLDQATPSLMRGTENGSDPFFSPDGQWVGFFADNKMKKISVQGGAPVTLCDAPRPLGASWGQDGNIIAALSSTEGLARVPEAGGIPQRLTTPEHGELTLRYPQVLPGSNAVLFTASESVAPGQFDRANIEVLSLKTGERKTLVRDGYFGRFLPTRGSAGHLIYMRQGSLFGMAFDPARLEVQGSPTPLVEDVAAQFDFSRTGTFLYAAGNGRASDATWPVVWLDSSGKTQPLIAAPGRYYTPRFSPDGRRLALAVDGSKGRDIYVYDLQRDRVSPVTFTGQNHSYPLWTPDGRHIVFNYRSGGDYGISWIRADGAGETQRLLEGKNLLIPYSFSPDGRHLAFSKLSPETGVDILRLPLDLSDPEHPKPGKPEALTRVPSNKHYPAYSPNGRWIAYASDESGRYEVYVRPSPAEASSSVQWQVSIGGGENPIWARDSRELFFTSPDQHIMVTAATAEGASFVSSKPRLWSPAQIRQPVVSTYLDLASDGKRFAVFPMAEAGEQEKGSVHVNFLLNFFDEVRRKIPAEGK